VKIAVLRPSASRGRALPHRRDYRYRHTHSRSLRERSERNACVPHVPRLPCASLSSCR